jgi:hypothetical protein
MVMGVLWTTMPATAHFVLRARRLEPDIRVSIVTAAVSLLVLAALGYWARETLMKTALNRRISAITAFTLVGQAVLGAAFTLTNVDGTTAVTFNFFMWFVVLSIASITVEPGMWPSAVVYLAALFLSLLFRDVVFLIMSASHFALTINAVFIWRKMFSGFRPDHA